MMRGGNERTAVCAMSWLAGCAMVVVMLAPPAWAQASAQPTNAPPNALQGFSQNRDKPVAIESTTLEVRDKEKVATFLGSVKLVQGDTTLRCKTLVVFYDQNMAPGAPPAAATTPAGSGNNQQIKRIEAKGDVVVTQKDQTATGENGTFDMASNTVVMTGHVVMTQGVNVVKGDRLWVDMNTGLSRVECKSSQCKVQALFQPNAVRDPKADAKTDSKTEAGAGKDAAKPAPRLAPISSPLNLSRPN